MHAKRRGDRLRHQQRIAQRRQLNEPDAVCVHFGDAGGELQGKARFADATRADQRHQALARQLLTNANQLCVASDEAGELQGQVVACWLEVPRPGR